MKTISITGVHGSGKTNLVNRLAEHYASMGKTVYIGEEAARKCPYSLGTIRAQRWIWYAHWDIETEARKCGCDIVILDRSVMDNLVYFREVLDQNPSDYGEEMFKFFCAIAKRHIRKYDCVCRLPLNEEYLLNADDDLRPKDIEYAKRIDKMFDAMVDNFVNASVEDLFDFGQG